MDYMTDVIDLTNSGDLSALKNIFEKGYSVDSQDSEGTTALQVASANGYDDIVSYLLSQNASVDLPNTYGWTPLMLAARYGHVSSMAILLNYRAKVNILNRLGLTPLLAAVYSGQISAVKLLFDAGAIVGYSSLRDTSVCFITSLMVAAFYGYESIVHLLLKKGAHVDSTLNVTGWTPLMLAACSGHEKIARYLVEHNADVTSTDICQKTALDIASRAQYKDLKSYLESIQPSKEPTPKDIRDAKFMRAILKDDFPEVKSLLKKDPSYANARDSSDGISALMLASMQGLCDVVELLIRNKANINAQDLADGWTALMHAVFHNHADVVKLLINNGADIYIRASNGYTVLDLMSYMKKNDKILEVLKTKLLSSSSSFSNPDSFVSPTFLAAHMDKKNLSQFLKSTTIRSSSSSSSSSTRVKEWFSTKFHSVFSRSPSRRSNAGLTPEVKVSKSFVYDDIFSTPHKNDSLNQTTLSLSSLRSPNRYLSQNLKKHQVESINSPFRNFSPSGDEENEELLRLKKVQKNPGVGIFTPNLLKEYIHNNPNLTNVSRTLFNTPRVKKEQSRRRSQLSNRGSTHEEVNGNMNVPEVSISTPVKSNDAQVKDTANEDLSLSKLLEKKSLGQHIQKFKEHEIDIDAFACLKKEDFSEMGIDSTMSCEALCEILNGLKRTTDV